MAVDKRYCLSELCSVPAIARLTVLDDSDQLKTIYITRGTPHGPTPRGEMVASYRSPIGRLAALVVGQDHDLTIGGRDRSFSILSRADLTPKELAQQWDSIPTELFRAGFTTVTIRSLRATLASTDVKENVLDILDRLLDEDRADRNVVEGLRRSVIIKMTLRDRPRLDSYQDEIFRLPLGSKLAILGPPGTGKTTTLIKRLGLKLDLDYLEPEEVAEINRSAATLVGHSQSWLLFTPTELLKQYVKEAFGREGIPASDLRMQTWADYRQDLARNKLGIFRTSTGRGAIMREHLLSLSPHTEKKQRGWFDDFVIWQSSMFWAGLEANVAQLIDDSDVEVARLGRQLAGILSGPRDRPAASFLAFDDLANGVSALAAKIRTAVDVRLRRAFADQLQIERNLLDGLLAFVSTLGDAVDSADDADEIDGEEEDDEEAPPRLNREDAFETYRRAVRARARAVASQRSIGRRTRNGRVLDYLGERVPAESELLALGERLQTVAALRSFANPLRQYVGRIPARYRRFRRDRQAQGSWYRPDGFSPSELSPLEVDIVVLATLRAANSLLTERAVVQRLDTPRFATLKIVRELWRNQIVVDEATDFSPVQLGCMGALRDVAVDSFMACGDFNQRITNWGSRSVEDLRWAVPDLNIKPIVINYRHSRELADFASQLASLSGDTVAPADLPPDVDSQGVKPVLGLALSAADTVDWLAARIVEIERFTGSLPSVAILVNSEEEVRPLAARLGAALASRNIRVAACSNGQVVGQDIDVRVFDIQHIKGLEFEAVFFVEIDILSERRPDLFDKYLYVGATRAATYLGLTCLAEVLPRGLHTLAPLFGTDWRPAATPIPGENPLTTP